MRVLVDITHPAHVHFYRNLHQRLIDSGHDVLVVGREKDVTLELLDAYRISHLIHGRSGSRGLIRQGIELASRVAYLVRHGRRFRPDLVLTRNPAGVQAARVIGALGVFDTDDAQSVGLHFRPRPRLPTSSLAPTASRGVSGRRSAATRATNRSPICIPTSTNPSTP